MAQTSLLTLESHREVEDGDVDVQQQVELVQITPALEARDCGSATVRPAVLNAGTCSDPEPAFVKLFAVRVHLLYLKGLFEEGLLVGHALLKPWPATRLRLWCC